MQAVKLLRVSRPTIGAWLLIDQPQDCSSFSQVGADSSRPNFQAVYWRTAAVFYASSRRANPAARHALFTNAEPPVVDGHDLAAFFQGMEVELIDVPLTYRPPKTYWHSWRNQFYLLDLIR